MIYFRYILDTSVVCVHIVTHVCRPTCFSAYGVTCYACARSQGSVPWIVSCSSSSCNRRAELDSSFIVIINVIVFSLTLVFLFFLIKFKGFRILFLNRF